jgi:hypothetical protein
MIFDTADTLRIPISDQKVLDVDRNLLVALRKLALDEARLTIIEHPADFNFLGVHATFRWKGRIISGLNYRELRGFDVGGVLNVIDDVSRIRQKNIQNPKWTDSEVPSVEETNDWLMEEEFITEVLADFLDVPMFLVGRQHNPENLADLFLTNKRKMYLSYPITHIQRESPELLNRVRHVILPQLEQRFVVFDPMVVEDMPLAAPCPDGVPDAICEVPEDAAEVIKARTVERDFQFIDQSDFVVVIYLSRHSKPVFMVFPYARSPFLQEYATRLFDDESQLLAYFDSEEFRERFAAP